MRFKPFGFFFCFVRVFAVDSFFFTVLAFVCFPHLLLFLFGLFVFVFFLFFFSSFFCFLFWPFGFFFFVLFSLFFCFLLFYCLLFSLFSFPPYSRFGLLLRAFRRVFASAHFDPQPSLPELIPS